MPDPFEICIFSVLKSSAKKFVQQIRALRRIKIWKRRKPQKRLFSDSNYLSNSSFAAMEATNQLKQVFKFFDANGDGKISPLEMREVLLNLGHEKAMAIKEAEGMVKEMDKDGDGFVDIEEFIETVNVDDKMVKEEDEIMDAFMIFDSDKDGFISPQELLWVFISLGYENCSLGECKNMIKGVDRDGDGFVDFEEFRSMMTCLNRGRVPV